MRPAIRGQADDDQSYWAKKAAITSDGSPSLTRQEQANDADINILLKRFGVAQQLRTNARFGEYDETLDLQAALSAVALAREANYNVPAELREKYPNWQAVLEGAESGTYEQDLAALKLKREAEKREQQKAELRRNAELSLEIAADMRAEAAAAQARAQTDTPKP